MRQERQQADMPLSIILQILTDLTVLVKLQAGVKLQTAVVPETLRPMALCPHFWL